MGIIIILFCHVGRRIVYLMNLEDKKFPLWIFKTLFEKVSQCNSPLMTRERWFVKSSKKHNFQVLCGLPLWSVGWSHLPPGENIRGVLDYMSTGHIMEVIGRWETVEIWAMVGIGYWMKDEYDWSRRAKIPTGYWREDLGKWRDLSLGNWLSQWQSWPVRKGRLLNRTKQKKLDLCWQMRWKIFLIQTMKIIW